MMINRDEFITEVMSSISARLKVELEAPLKELLVGFEDSREVLAAARKDLAEDMCKLKSNEDFLKPSFGSIPNINTDSEIIPIESKSVSNFVLHSPIPIDSNLAGEGNCISTTRTQYLDKDEVCSDVGVLKHNENSASLYYQEGKPFIPSTDFMVDFQSKRFATHEVNDFNSFNQNNNISENSSELNVLKKQCSVECLNCCLDSARILFDCGKFLEAIKRYPYYVSNNIKFNLDMLTSCLVQIMDDCGGKCVNELVCKHGYWSELMFSKAVACILTGGVTVTAWILFVKTPKIVAWSLGSDGYYFLWQLQRVTCCVSILLRSIWMDEYSENSIYNVLLELGYHLDMSLDYSNVLVFVENGDSRGVSKLFDNMPYQSGILLTVFLLQTTQEATYGKARELFHQLHHTGRVSWGGDIASLILHLRCRLRSKLVTHSVIHRSGRVQKFLDKMADHVSGSLGTVVWKIPLKELRYLQAFVISIPTVVKGHIYLSVIDFLHVLLLTPEVYESFSFRDRVIMTVVYSTWSSYYSFYCAQHWSSGCNQLMGVCINALPLNVLNCVTSICGELHYRPRRVVFVLIVYWQGYIIRNPSILTYIPNILMLVAFLKWKFKLFSTGPWGVGTVSENISVLVEVECILLKVLDTNERRIWVFHVTTNGVISMIRSIGKRKAVTMLITVIRKVMQPKTDTRDSLSSFVVVGSAGLLHNHFWKVGFWILQKCSTHTASLPSHLTKFHITEVGKLQSEEVKLIFVTTLHGFPIYLLYFKVYILRRRCWQKKQKFLAVNLIDRTGILHLVMIIIDIKETGLVKIPQIVVNNSEQLKFPFGNVGGKEELCIRKRVVGYLMSEPMILPIFKQVRSTSSHGKQQLFLTTRRKSMDKGIVLAAEYFLENSHQFLKQLKLSTVSFTRTQGGESQQDHTPPFFEKFYISEMQQLQRRRAHNLRSEIAPFDTRWTTEWIYAWNLVSWQQPLEEFLIRVTWNLKLTTTEIFCMEKVATWSLIELLLVLLVDKFIGKDSYMWSFWAHYENIILLPSGYINTLVAHEPHITGMIEVLQGKREEVVVIIILYKQVKTASITTVYLITRVAPSGFKQLKTFVARSYTLFSRFIRIAGTLFNRWISTSARQLEKTSFIFNLILEDKDVLEGLVFVMSHVVVKGTHRVRGALGIVGLASSCVWHVLELLSWFIRESVFLFQLIE